MWLVLTGTPTLNNDWGRFTGVGIRIEFYIELYVFELLSLRIKVRDYRTRFVTQGPPSVKFTGYFGSFCKKSCFSNRIHLCSFEQLLSWPRGTERKGGSGVEVGVGGVSRVPSVELLVKRFGNLIIEVYSRFLCNSCTRNPSCCLFT